MKPKKKNVITGALAVSLAAAMLIGGGSFAYLRSDSKLVTNNFDPNKVTVELNETTGSKYSIVPGTVQSKDPKVTVNNTVDSYVFVKVTDTTDGLVIYAIANGWNKLDGYDNVYWREVGKDDEVKTFSVLNGDKVEYSADLKNGDMLDESGKLKEGLALSFEAKAVQTTGFSSPQAAYTEKTGTAVSDTESLAAAIKKGDSVMLSTDITLNSAEATTYDLAENAAIDLNGKTLTIPTMAIFQGKNTLIENGNISNGDSSVPYGLFIGGAGEETSMTVKNVALDSGIYVNDANATLDNVTVDDSKQNSYAVYVINGSVTINSGTYTGGTSSITGNRVSAVVVGPYSNVVINGGTFVGGVKASQTAAEAKLTVYGGKFDENVTRYIGEGCTVEETVEGDTTWYTVVNNAKG